MEKKNIRKKILDDRKSLTKEEHIKRSKDITERIMNSDFYKDAKTIMIFVSFSDEVDTHEFIKLAIEDGKNIVVPVTFKEGRIMKPSLVKSFDELAPGFYNILSPKEEYIRYVDKEEIDLVLTPSVAFDKRGYRVGYGGGYYDRFFSGLDVIKVGIGFDLQIVDFNLPTDQYDIPVDYIISESNFIVCNE